jgi:hypothetical protein
MGLIEWCADQDWVSIDTDSLNEKLHETKRRILDRIMEKKKILYEGLIKSRKIRDDKYSRMNITIFYINKIREIKDMEKIIVEEFGGKNE